MTKELETYIALVDRHFEELEKFGVKKIAFFGSTVRGDSTRKSDIDIVVELKDPIGIFAFIRLENYLRKIFGKKVDLATKKSLKPAVRKSILKEAVYA